MPLTFCNHLLREHLIPLPQTILVSDDDQENWLELLPFSTLGPGSLLGSSVASNIDLSLHTAPKKSIYCHGILCQWNFYRF